MSTWETEEEEEKMKIKRKKEENIKIDCRDTGFKGSSCTKLGLTQVMTSVTVSLKRFCYCSEPTALGWHKVRCYVEVPEQDKLLPFLSIYGYQLAIGYFGIVTGGGVISSSFLGGFRGWGLVLAVWTPL